MPFITNKARILTIAMIFVLITSYVLFTHGQFHIFMSNSISRKSLEPPENLYVGNTVEWEGILRPVILDMKIVDGVIISTLRMVH